jgi:L-ascorbate metabolism protein UlaG (beta-lactamase superfamily)
MKITWHGQSLFQITTSSERNTQVNIVIDPFDQSTGLRIPKLKADILLVTHAHPDHNNIGAVSGDPVLIEGPGEYESRNIFIYGIDSMHDNSQGKEMGRNTIYTIENEDIRICHLGDIGQKELTEEQLEKIGDVDILMIPVGGNFTIGAEDAIKMMSQIEPKITIPMHYAIPKLKIKLDPLNKFLKGFGIKPIQPINKLSIKKKDISSEEAKIIVLEP